MEAPNGTKLSARAAAGQTTSERLELKKPDTVIYRPDGKQLQMGRAPRRNATISFEKSNPRRGSNGKRLRKPDLASAAQIPFVQTLVAGFIIYKAGGYLLHKLLNRSDKRKQLAIANAEEDELGSELDAEDVAEMYGGGLPEGYLPAMLRASLPKPNRMGLAKRAGTLAHSRIQSHKTSHQMLHPGTAQVTGQGRCTAQQRPLGKLERMDMLARQQVRALMVAQRDQQLLLESSAASDTQPQLEGQSQHPALPSTSVTSTAAGATATTAASASQAGEAALVLRSPRPQQQLAQRMPQQSARPGSDFSCQPIPNLPALPTTASRPDAQRMLGMYEQAMQTRAKAEASARMPLPVASTSGRQPGPMQGGPGQQGESSSRGEAASSSGVTAGPPASATTQPAVVRVRRPQQPASATDSTSASSSGPAGSSGNNSSSRVIEQADASGSQASGALADAVAGTGAGAPIGDGLVAGAVESGPAGTVSGDVLSKGSGQAPSSAVP